MASGKEIKTDIAVQVAKAHLDMAERAAKGESYASIGEIYNMSRQRVEKIIRRLTTNFDQSKMGKEVA